MNTEELQQKYYEFQVLNEHIQKIKQQIALVAKQIEELERVNLALSSVIESKEGSKILCPLGAGVYAHTELKSSSEIVMGVGANIYVAKGAKEAKIQVENQLNEMQDIMSQLDKELNAKTKEFQVVQAEIRSEMNKSK